MISRSLAQHALRLASTTSTRRLTTLHQRPQARPLKSNLPVLSVRTATTSTPSQSQPPQNTPAGDAAVEEITELYATAYDEFEIASESTEANATYAEEDRNAAREELDKVLEAYQRASSGDSAEEVRRRIGQRIRELEQGVKVMEEKALEHD